MPLSAHEERRLQESFLRETPLTGKTASERLLLAQKNLHEALDALAPEWRAQLLEEWGSHEFPSHTTHPVHFFLRVDLESAHNHCCHELVAHCAWQNRTATNGFVAQLTATNNTFQLHLKEHYTMEPHHTSLTTSLTLGSIDIPLQEALELRPGDVIELTNASSLTGTLCIGGGEWLTVRLTPSDEGIELEVSGLGEHNQLI